MMVRITIIIIIIMMMTILFKIMTIMIMITIFLITINMYVGFPGHDVILEFVRVTTPWIGRHCVSQIDSY